jgi:hypothetical protein
MSSLSTFSSGLLEAFKSSLLQFLLKVQDHGIFSIGTILAFIVFYTARYLASPYRKLPPGPRGYPIIGNLFDLGPLRWLKFAEWQKMYGRSIVPILCYVLPELNLIASGDLIYLNAAGQPMVILNSQRVAVDLFDRRASIYSDRPRSIVLCEIMTNGLLFGFSPITDS